ncbi:MAG: PH domain-containing protein [Nakamurella sp.]
MSSTRTARLVFRLPVVALVMPAVLLFCVVPLGATGGWRLVMFGIPLAALVWVVITRTTADAAGLRVTGLATRRRLSWTQIGRVELDGGRWVVVTDRGGRRTRLPMVLPGDLPRLVEVSGGAFDPAAPA